MGLRADKEELQDLNIAFKQMDLDNDGTLSFEEIMAAEKDLQSFKLGNKWRDVLKKCDLDGDGKIDFQEFFTAAVNHQKILTEQNIEFAFKTLDTNGDGQIDIEEFKQNLPTNYKKSLYGIEGKDTSIPIIRKGSNQFNSTKVSSSGVDEFDQQRAIFEKQNQRDNQKWEEILAEVDTNGDGII
mmetsp:Transcript_12713/g.21415  ORF Transcript_12713/g.21415 Transcript_12713/m.21415 type:complete len:184 (+) Transcript_12713:1094-1645(+)